MLGASQGFYANIRVDSGAHFYVRIYSVIRWPLELLIDDSGGFAPKRVKPIGNRGSPVPKNLVQKLTSNSRVAVSLLMFF